MKKNIIRKIFVALLAVALAFGLTVPTGAVSTFAAEGDEHMIYMDTMGGTILGSAFVKNSYIEGIGCKLPTSEDIVKDGYTFQGWLDLDNNTIITEIGQDATKDFWIEAQWTEGSGDSNSGNDGQTGNNGSDENAEIFTVTFCVPEEPGSPLYHILSEQQVQAGNDAIPPEVPEYPGYKFIGWDKDYKNITADTELYAQYDFDEDYYKVYVVTFIDYDGSVLDVQEIAAGKSAYAPSAPTRTGYTFVGWDKDFSSVTSDLTVKAQYKIKSYTVKFKNYNGKILKTQKVNYGKAAKAPKAPKRKGYKFVGWNKTFTKVTKNMTVKAKFTKK